MRELSPSSRSCQQPPRLRRPSIYSARTSSVSSQSLALPCVTLSAYGRPVVTTEQMNSFRIECDRQHIADLDVDRPRLRQQNAVVLSRRAERYDGNVSQR